VGASVAVVVVSPLEVGAAVVVVTSVAAVVSSLQATSPPKVRHASSENATNRNNLCILFKSSFYLILLVGLIY
jgi:hypothetical protein